MGRRWGCKSGRPDFRGPCQRRGLARAPTAFCFPGGPLSRVSQPEPFLMAFLSAGKGARSSQPCRGYGPASMSVSEQVCL